MVGIEIRGIKEILVEEVVQVASGPWMLRLIIRHAYGCQTVELFAGDPDSLELRRPEIRTVARRTEDGG